MIMINVKTTSKDNIILFYTHRGILKWANFPLQKARTCKSTQALNLNLIDIQIYRFFVYLRVDGIIFESDPHGKFLTQSLREEYCY